MKPFLPKKKRLRKEMRPTTDDWYPNFPGNMVEVNVQELSNKLWRVSVWGNDDYGMEIDVQTRMQALDIYQSLPIIITQQDLYERGFVAA